MRKAALSIVGTTLVMLACTEAPNGAPLTGPQFSSTYGHCEEGDSLVPVLAGSVIDKNGNGQVCFGYGKNQRFAPELGTTTMTS